MLSENKLQQVRESLQKDLLGATDKFSLEKVRLKYLARKNGLITLLFGEISKLSLAQKRQLVSKLNSLKGFAEKEIAEHFLRELPKAEAKEEKIFFDPTLPGNLPKVGHAHPTQIVIEEIKDIFRYLGFDSQDGPEVELDIYNFQKLRLHKNHPARDTQQTFYITEEILLRTQTSSMQIRYMEKHKPPIRMLFPGRVYRREQIDATHLPSFFQLEGLLVDKTTTMTDLIGSINFFIKKMFGTKTKIRIYGHHFPYTEPSIEVEMLHKNGKWLEIMGAGMVHPEVLKNCGIDQHRYRGWAFGMGPERIAMLKYGIEDIRYFYANEMSFLKQF